MFDDEDSELLIAVGAHSCGHVTISFLHLRPDDIAELVAFIAAHPDSFADMLLDRVVETMAAGLPSPEAFTAQHNHSEGEP